MDQIIRYKCPKCGNNQYSTGEIWGAGNFLAKISGLQTRRFTFITCNRCQFTEFYKIPLKKLGEVVNFIAR